MQKAFIKGRIVEMDARIVTFFFQRYGRKKEC